MKVVAIVAIIAAVVAVLFTVVGNPFIQPETDETGTPFGTGIVHQVRPAEVRVKITNSWAETIPPAESVIEIYNSSSTTTTFEIDYEGNPDLWPDFQAPPEEAESWVTLSHPAISVPGKSVGSVTVTLNIPPKTLSEDWMFWICVSEVKEGSIQTRIATVWLIEMR